MSGSLVPTIPETICVILENEGDGFGLVFSDKRIANEVPVIEAIKPRSPAHKAGILEVGDRIVTINGIETLQLTPILFSDLKKEALGASEITLMVEIDVHDAKILFGTFDVVLEDKLDIGFIFHEMKEKSPMVLKGILQGSAAHRSGQVFPGDEITFIKHKKSEVYDPLTSNFTKLKTVTITIRRDPKKILDMDRKRRSAPDIKASNPSLRLSDPPSSNSNPRYREKTVVSRSRMNIDSHSDDGPSLIAPDTRSINPSQCFTDETSYFSIPCLQQKKNASGNAVLGLDREDKPESTRDIRVTNPSSRSLNSSSCYTNPTFGKELKTDNRSISKTSISVDHDCKETLILSTPDIRAPNPSLCSSYSSSNYSNSRYEQELKIINRSSSKNSLFSDHSLLGIHREDTPDLNTPDIRAPNPSLCSSYSSSNYSNSRYEQELNNKNQLSSKNSVFSEHSLLDIHREDTSILSTPDIKVPNPSLCSTDFSSSNSYSSWEQKLRKILRSSSKNAPISDRTLLANLREDTPVLSTPDIKVPHPSPCPTDLSSNNSNSRCERKFRKIACSSNKYSQISNYTFSVNEFEDTQFECTPDIRAPNPSLCSSDSTSCYSNTPRFQKGESKNNYEELLKNKLRPSRKSSVIVDHGHEDTSALSALDIRAPNPSPCSSDQSSCYTNSNRLRFQQEKNQNNYEELLKNKLRPSRKSSLIVDHGHENTSTFGVLDIRAPNPSPCSTDQSSFYTNPHFQRTESIPESDDLPCFQQEKRRNNYEELLKNKLRASRKNSAIVDHSHEDTPALSVLDIRAPNPSPCPTDQSSCYTNPYFQRNESIPESEEIFVKRNTIIQSFRKNSAVIDHEVTIYRNSTSIDFGIQFAQNQVTGDWYVKDIRPGGPAHKSGVIKKFDKIIEVNGVLVHRFTDISLLESFSQSDQAGHEMTLVIRKVYREELNEVQAKNKGRVK